MAKKENRGSSLKRTDYNRLYYRARHRGINKGLKEGSQELRDFIHESIREEQAQGRTGKLPRKHSQEYPKKKFDPIFRKCCSMLMETKGFVNRADLKKCIDEEIYAEIHRCLTEKKPIPLYVRKRIEPLDVTPIRDETLEDFFMNPEDTHKSKKEFDSWMKKKGKSSSYEQIMAKLKELEQNE